MHTSYRLKATEINEDLLRSIRALYHDKVVEIRIDEVDYASENVTLTTMPRRAGALKGRIRIEEDFDAPLADFDEYSS